MDRNEALAALDGVKHTQGKLAEVSEWPLWRHVLFGVAEGTFIFGLSLPILGTAACLIAAGGLVAWMIRDDKQRYGMFVSGFQGKKPRAALFALIIVVVGMAALSFAARGEPAPAPMAIVATLGTIIACTLGSLWWQRLYRAELREGAVK